MAIILNCDKCGKRMGSLEPYTILDSKYLCKKCGDVPKKTESEAIVDFYEGLEIGHPSWLGYWNRQEYKVFIDNGYVFVSSVPILMNPANSFADQFDNKKFIILAYSVHWCVYDVKGNKVCDSQPASYNGFNAYSQVYMNNVIKRFL